MSMTANSQNPMTMSEFLNYLRGSDATVELAHDLCDVLEVRCARARARELLALTA